jgi:hypothetical protein
MMRNQAVRTGGAPPSAQFARDWLAGGFGALLGERVSRSRSE